MKTIGVRVSELEQKRLTELASKKGGTISNCVREIVSDFFAKTGKDEVDKAEHEKTRRDMDMNFKTTDEQIIQIANHVLETKKNSEELISALKMFGGTLGQVLAQRQEATK